MEQFKKKTGVVRGTIPGFFSGCLHGQQCRVYHIRLDDIGIDTTKVTLTLVTFVQYITYTIGVECINSKIVVGFVGSVRIDMGDIGWRLVKSVELSSLVT